MPTVRVTHNIGDLANDLKRTPAKMRTQTTGIVRRNVEQGTTLARRFAQEAAGPHGSNYYKRISGEMTGPLSGEYGPTGVVEDNAVGAGWRNGPPNTDLEKSLDIQGPRFERDIGSMIDGLFW